MINSGATAMDIMTNDALDTPQKKLLLGSSLGLSASQVDDAYAVLRRSAKLLLGIRRKMGREGVQ